MARASSSPTATTRCRRGPRAGRRVYLNLAPDLVRVTDVLAVLVDAIPIEAAHVMTPTPATSRRSSRNSAPCLPGVPLSPLGRFEFYDAASAPGVALAIATGERRIYANILLAIGVVAPEATVR